MSTKMRKTLTLFLVSVSLLSVFELISTPSVLAIPAISINPTNGYVGALVAVTGTVDTLNGTFKIRWDQKANLTTGKAVGNQVTASFTVPATNASISGRAITVELIDVNASTVSSPVDFNLLTKFSLHVDVPTLPQQLQEGAVTSVRVNVTGGSPNTIYVANITVKNPANQTRSHIVLLSNTTATGSGGAVKTYPNDFGAHTNLTGTYQVAFNETLATTQFFVGLTDKTEYRRNDSVHIQAAGYKPSETVNVNIETQGESVSGFPKNYTASSGGLVTLTWTVPVNATSGAYRVTMTNTTTAGTVKVPSDAQDFNVTGARCFIKAVNLAGEAVEGASIEVYNQTAPTVVQVKGNTNGTGWIQFNLDQGNYTFKGFVKDVKAGLLANRTVTADVELDLQLRLVNFEALAETEEGQDVPLIAILLKYNRTTRDNKTVADSSVTQTNATGRATIRNLFVNTTYQVKASRYGMLFSNTTVSVPSSPASPRIPLNLTLPTYFLSVHGVDSKNTAATQIIIKVFEWTSGVTNPFASMETNSSGDASFSLPFGRYILRAYRSEDFLSEAVINLDKPVAFTFDLKTLNVDVAIFVFDYFGQPLANAEVRIERQTGQGLVLVSTKTTSSDGSARFASILGGDFQVSVYVGGQLVGTKTQFVEAGSEDVEFVVGEYVNLLGFPIVTGAFALILFLIVVIVVALVLTRRRILSVFRKRAKR